MQTGFKGSDADQTHGSERVLNLEPICTPSEPSLDVSEPFPSFPRVLSRNFKQRPVRFGADDVRQGIGRFARAGVVVFGQHEHLKIRGEPLFRNDPDRLLIANRPCRECRDHASTARADTLNHPFTQVLTGDEFVQR